MSRSATPALPLHNGSSKLRPPSPSLSARSVSPNRPTNTPTQSITSGYAVLSKEEAAERLSTSLSHGLSQAEASARLHSTGPNELPHDEPEPLWLRFLKQFKETLILLLLTSAAVSFVMGNLEDAISITTAVIIVVTVGFVQEYRSEKSLEALSKMVPHFANVTRGGVTSSQQADGLSDASRIIGAKAQTNGLEQTSSSTSAALVVPGDLVSFNTGDRIPADVRITRSTELSIDESNLTGENEPVPKHTEAIPLSSHGGELRLNEQSNIGFMGTLVRSGYGQGIVVGTGGNTEFGAVSASLQEIESPRTPLQLAMDKLGKELSYISFGVIGLIMLVGVLRGWKFLEMFQIGVSLAVAAIPEGLPIIVTVTLALGVFRMSKRNAIVKRLPSVETLGSVNVICSDKTGTLTMNHMTVSKIWHHDAPSPFEASTLHGVANPDNATKKILRIGNIANNSRLAGHALHHRSTAASSAVWASTIGDEESHVKSRWLGSPTEVALLDLLDTLGEHDIRESLGPRARETPFSSERKWMGVSIQASSESLGSETGYIKGAVERVIKRCDTYITKDGREVVMDEACRTKIMAAADSMANEGLRVLAFASGSITPKSRPNGMVKARSGASTPASGVDASLGGSTISADEESFTGLAFAGLVGMNDPPRKNVDRSIRRLTAGGVKVIMITGDSESTAVAIGRKIGMPINMSSAVGRAVIRGEELDKMSEQELAHVIATASIFARTSPEHKMKIIRALQSRGDIVAMTGDGVNDAPALKKADIGISMGRLGTDVAKEAADMILTDDDFSTILNAIEEGKGIFSNIQNFITFQLSTSVAALSLVMLSTILGFSNPLNAMQILWINILMDGPPAQSLGVEPVDPAVMNRPPRSKNARVLTRMLLQRVIQSAAIIMMGTLLTYVREMSVDGLVTARDTTMTFTCFVFFDMFNALTCRSEGKSILRGEIRVFSNKMFNYAVAGSLLGQALVIYFPPFQRVFQTEALSFYDLIWLASITSSVFWADEARKYYKHRSKRRSLGKYSAHV